MITPITKEQALENLSDLYHPVVEQICQTHLQQDENIFMAADSSFRWSDTDCYIGLFILTTYRAISVIFPPSRRRDKIAYFEQGMGLFSFAESDRRHWFPSPYAPLTERELKYKEIREALLSSIAKVERDDYSASIGGQQFQIVELDYTGTDGRRGSYGTVGLYRTAFSLRDGQKIYSLLQNAIQNSGRIQFEEKGNDKVISQLERLAALHRSGALTEEEFKAAKAKLIGL